MIFGYLVSAYTTRIFPVCQFHVLNIVFLNGRGLAPKIEDRTQAGLVRGPEIR
jgi:hypothetical protein